MAERISDASDESSPGQSQEFVDPSTSFNAAAPLNGSEESLLQDGERAYGVDRSLSPARKLFDVDKDKKKRRSTRLEAVATSAASAISAATNSVLGKRGRDLLESNKDKTKALARASKSRRLSQQPTKTSGDKTRRKSDSAIVLSSPTEADDATTPHASMPRKKWLKEGIYAGCSLPKDARMALSKAKGRTQPCDKIENPILPMPFYLGDQIIRQGRDFKLPFDIYSPLPRGQPKPEEWKKTQTNRFVNDAAKEWKKAKPLPPSMCLCTVDSPCGENCLNRVMEYECDESNCAIGKDHCNNRSFAELEKRRERGSKFDIGVEVMKTSSKGFGVRACRGFEPGQIIVEYTGEIITQDECERRMLNEYKEKDCFYLMAFDQNMIIDATRGSIARFVNHSCAPNCQMVKLIVGGKPHLALFAGDQGIQTGEELTYDYNYDPFGKTVQQCLCGASNCRGVIGPKPSKDKARELLQKSIAQVSKSVALNLPKKEKVVAGAKRKLNQMLESVALPSTKKNVPKQKVVKTTQGKEDELPPGKRTKLTGKLTDYFARHSGASHPAAAPPPSFAHLFPNLIGARRLGKEPRPSSEQLFAKDSSMGIQRSSAVSSGTTLIGQDDAPKPAPLPSGDTIRLQKVDHRSPSPSPSHESSSDNAHSITLPLASVPLLPNDANVRTRRHSAAAALHRATEGMARRAALFGGRVARGVKRSYEYDDDDDEDEENSTPQEEEEAEERSSNATPPNRRVSVEL